MQTLTRFIGIVMLAVLIGQPLVALPALAQATVTLSGTVVDPAATPISGATVTANGPTSASATTDKDGVFSLSIPPGVYRVLVHAPGYNDAFDDAVTLSDSGGTLNFQLIRPTLSSLQTIGTVRSSNTAAGPQFNATSGSVATINSTTFDNQGDVGVRDILDETPGIIDTSSNGSANGGVRGSITYPTIRGGLSYETASLIDGHPVSVGKYGDYVTTFLNRYMFQDIEVQKGPGTFPQQIARSVNGTVNFRTWDPTSRLTGNLTYGVDGFGGSFSNIRISDTLLNGKLGFVFAYATEGTPGAAGNSNPSSFIASLGNVTYTDSQGVPVTVGGYTTSHPGNAANTTTTQYTTSTIGCCIAMPTWFSSRMELGKLRFNFSDVTSFTATVLASQSFASQNGNNQNLQNVNFQPAVPNATLSTGMHYAFFPFNDNFAQDYEFNNEPMFEGEFHSQIKDDNVLARFYSASIGRLQTNNDPGNVPLAFPVYLYGTTAAGAPLDGTDPYGRPYIATVTSPLYTSNEQDNLTGYTFEYDHSLGSNGNTLSFVADENYSATHVFTPGQPDSSSTSNIPAGSQQNTGTYSIKGDFIVGSRLNVTAAYYLSRFDTHYAIFTGSGAPYAYTFADNIFWHNDARLGLQYRLSHDTSLRLGVGSALVPPFLGVITGQNSAPAACTASNCPAGFQPGTVYVNTVGGLNILPETSFGYDLGIDHRWGPRWPFTVVSADVYLTNLQNQYLKTVYPNGTYAAGGLTLPLYTTAYSNLADSRYMGAEVRISHAPPQGLGYAVQAAVLRGFPYNVPPSIYQFNAAGQATSNQGVVTGANFGPATLLSSGGSSIPYSQGYAELSYTLPQGWYANLGVIYFGPNNTFNEPAFPVTRFTLRAPIHSKATYLQFSMDNVFNINSEVFDVAGSGVQAPAINGQVITTNLKGYGPRNIHLSLVHNMK